MVVRGGAETSPSQAQPAVRAKAPLRAFLRLLNRRKIFLLGTVAIAVMGTSLVLLALPPEYKSTAFVLVDVNSSRVVGLNGLSNSGATGHPDANTEAEFVRSHALLGRVVDKLNLEVDPEFGAAPESAFSHIALWVTKFISSIFESQPTGQRAPTREERLPRLRATSRLAEMVTVRAQETSGLVGVSVQSMDSTKAKRVADAIAEFYIADKLQAVREADDRKVVLLDKGVTDLQQAADLSELAVARFREKSGITSSEQKMALQRQIADFSSQLSQARAQRVDREARLKALRQAQSTPVSRGGATEFLTSPVVAALRVQEAEVARRIADLAQRYGDNYPRVSQAKAELGQIRSDIGAEVAKIIVSVQGDIDAARAKETLLQGEISRLEQQAGSLERSEAELQQLQRRAQADRSALEDGLRRSSEARQQREMREPSARLFAPASISRDAAFPRYGFTLGVALVTGLLIGLTGIGLGEYFDSGFRSGEQIEWHTGRALIGMVPKLPRSVIRKWPPEQYVIERPTSVYAEALRSIQTSIALGVGRGRQPKVIMVTSSVPGEGKSTFTCSLATLVARSNPAAKILVVDCDLRRASVRNLLNVPATEGTLDRYLSKSKPLEGILGRVKGSGLFYVLARENTANSAELLGSRDMRSLMGALSKQFDLVLLDTPPLMAVPDSRVVAQLSDYIVFLVRWEQTERTLAMNALKLLSDVPTDIGVVLSQVDIKRHARYGFNDHGHYYAKYHDYYLS